MPEDRRIERGEPFDERRAPLPAVREGGRFVEMHVPRCARLGDAVDAPVMPNDVRVREVRRFLDHRHGRGELPVRIPRQRGDVPLTRTVDEAFHEDHRPGFRLTMNGSAMNVPRGGSGSQGTGGRAPGVRKVAIGASTMPTFHTSCRKSRL